MNLSNSQFHSPIGLAERLRLMIGWRVSPSINGRSSLLSAVLSGVSVALGGRRSAKTDLRSAGGDLAALRLEYRALDEQEQQLKEQQLAGSRFAIYNLAAVRRRKEEIARKIFGHN